MLHHVVGFAAAVTALASLCGQSVPYNSSIASIIGNVLPSEGLWLADRTGVCLPITGLVAAGSLGSGVNAVRIDPIDDRIWLGGINSNGNTNNQVNFVRLTGTTVSQFVQFATVPVNPPTSVSAIEFDDNGNPLAVLGTAASGGGVFRIDRKNGGVATNIGAVASGIHNACCKDTLGNLYLGTFSGQVHVMAKNIDGSFQAPVLLGTTPITSISGMTFVPTDGVTPDEIWIGTFGVAGNNLFRMPATGGPGVATPNTSPASNWVAYDRRNNDVLVLTNTGPDNIERVDRATFANTVMATLQGGNVGVPAYLDVNNTLDGNVVVAPMNLNSGTGPFDLELGLTCPPGSLAIVGAAYPSLVILGVGFVGVDGRFSVNIPNVTLLGPLPPASLGFLGAFLDVSTGNLVIGNPVSWPAN